jgi:ribokinase
MSSGRPRIALVGHVEWVQFARVPRVPRTGEVMHAHDPFEEPAGGGAVAAVQAARLAGEAILMTVLGDDDYGRRSVERLRELGVLVYAASRSAPTRRAVALLDDAGERTITTFGARLEPAGSDEDLPWSLLKEMDAVYFTAGDAEALRAARAARVLVASPRALDALGHGVALDALVLSSNDSTEREEAAAASRDAALLVTTDGARGGSYRERSGESGRWQASPSAAPPVSTYGAGDSFAAGLTYGLAAGLDVPAAIDLAARCGAASLGGLGPYRHQLRLAPSGADCTPAARSPAAQPPAAQPPAAQPPRR